MLRVIAGSVVCQGVLKNYEMEGEDLVVRFDLRGESTSNLTLPRFPGGMLDAMKRLGLASLKNATIDMNTGNITLDDVLKPAPGKRQQVTAERRPRLNTISGGLVG